MADEKPGKDLQERIVLLIVGELTEIMRKVGLNTMSHEGLRRLKEAGWGVHRVSV